MRTLLILLFIVLSAAVCRAQHDPLDNWNAGAYSRYQADIFSSFSNVAALPEIREAGVAVTGLRRYGLPEMGVY